MSIKKAIGYVRRSSIKQNQNSSNEIQKTAETARANKEGYTIVYWIEDNAVSAFHKKAMKRAGIQKLMESIEKDNTIEALFFYDNSRIDRQIATFVLEVYMEIKRRKRYFKFFNAQQENGEWDPNNIQTQLNLISACNESIIKSKRAKDAQKKFLFNGTNPLRPGARPPFGFDLMDNVLAPNKNSVFIVFIFYLAAWGYSDKKIAEILNETSIPSPMGRKWCSSTVGSILNNLSYAGHLAWNVRKSIHNSSRKPIDEIDIFKNNHSPIVPSHFWTLIHQMRELKKEHGKFDSPFILRNLIFCKHCNQQLSTKDMSPAKSKNKYQYYLCPDCKSKIKAEEINDVILKRLGIDLNKQSTQIENHTQKLFGKWGNMLSTKIHQLKDQLKKIELNEQLNKQKSHMNSAESNMMQESFESAKNQIKESIEKANDSLETITTLLQDEKLHLFYKWFKDMKVLDLSNTEKRAITLYFFKKIEIDFNKDNTVSLDYRLTPFVELESTIGHIAELRV